MNWNSFIHWRFIHKKASVNLNNNYDKSQLQKTFPQISIIKPKEVYSLLMKQCNTERRSPSVTQSVRDSGWQRLHHLQHMAPKAAPRQWHSPNTWGGKKIHGIMQEVLGASPRRVYIASVYIPLARTCTLLIASAWKNLVSSMARTKWKEFNEHIALFLPVSLSRASCPALMSWSISWY